MPIEHVIRKGTPNYRGAFMLFPFDKKRAGYKPAPTMISDLGGRYR